MKRKRTGSRTILLGKYDNWMAVCRLGEDDNRFDYIARIVNAQSITIPARIEKQDKEGRDIATDSTQP